MTIRDDVDRRWIVTIERTVRASDETTAIQHVIRALDALPNRESYTVKHATPVKSVRRAG